VGLKNGKSGREKILKTGGGTLPSCTASYSIGFKAVNNEKAVGEISW
jgi:hypothetical protein